MENALLILEKAAPALLFAQELPSRPAYNLKSLEEFSFSKKTVYRRIEALRDLGLATYRRGSFTIKKGVVSQPLDVFKKLIPSLLALKKARRFGRSYNNADINFVRDSMPTSAIVTLDYRAWQLTEFQFPNDLHVYVDNLEKGASFLKENGFSEGSRGHIVLLPKLGSFENEIERVYFDCIANGGRSILDAIAIQLLYPDKISVKGRFDLETIRKVQQDMPLEKIKKVASINS